MDEINQLSTTLPLSKYSEIAQEKYLRTMREFLISTCSTIKNFNAVIDHVNQLG